MLVVRAAVGRVMVIVVAFAYSSQNIVSIRALKLRVVFSLDVKAYGRVIALATR